MKRATIDKDRHVGDPAFVECRSTTSPARPTRPCWPPRSAPGRRPTCRASTAAPPSRDTTHVSVVDAEGNCVTMTHSLGMPSGVITDGLGFMYNGCMGVFDPRPGRAGSLAPGKARFSSVVPVHRVRGATGRTWSSARRAAPRSRWVCLQALLNALDFDMTMVEAVSAPRFSATSNAIDVSNRIPLGVQRELEAQGYEVVRSPNTYGFAAVHAIRVHPDGLDGGADPGHDGIVLAVVESPSTGRAAGDPE